MIIMSLLSGYWVDYTEKTNKKHLKQFLVNRNFLINTSLSIAIVVIFISLSIQKLFKLQVRQGVIPALFYMLGYLLGMHKHKDV